VARANNSKALNFIYTKASKKTGDPEGGEIEQMCALSLRRYDPDQVQRVRPFWVITPDISGHLTAPQAFPLGMWAYFNPMMMEIPLL
jgi:hypothetical protein